MAKIFEVFKLLTCFKFSISTVSKQTFITIIIIITILKFFLCALKNELFCLRKIYCVFPLDYFLLYPKKCYALTCSKNCLISILLFEKRKSFFEKNVGINKNELDKKIISKICKFFSFCMKFLRQLIFCRKIR